MKRTKLFYNECFKERTFTSKRNFLEFVFSNSKAIFGESTILVPIDKSVTDKFTIHLLPDAFLFEFIDNEIIGRYIKIGYSGEKVGRLFRATFQLHINSFISKNDFFPKIFSYLPDKETLKKEINLKVGEKPIYEFLESCIYKTNAVTLVLDNEIPQLEIQDKALGMWNTIYVKEFKSDENKSIIQVSNLEYNMSIKELMDIL